YLQGKYAGDVPAIDALARSFINREVEKEKSQKITARFVPTVTSRKGMDVIRYAHLDGDLNVIYGAAGLGKTMILREYAAQHRDALLIEADPGYTARVVLEELCGLLGISKRGNMHELSEACIAALRDSGRLLMVDEAENLPYRALETLRRIHDKSGIGLVLAGMPRLIINLKGKRGEYQQLYSRVGFALCIGDSLPQSDITDIAVSMLPGAGSQDVSEALFKASHGNARRLFKLVRGVSRHSEISGNAVSAGAVRKFAEMLIN
ncbi:ATPase, partial [Klebsiella variicola]